MFKASRIIKLAFRCSTCTDSYPWPIAFKRNSVLVQAISVEYGSQGLCVDLRDCKYSEHHRCQNQRSDVKVRNVIHTLLTHLCQYEVANHLSMRHGELLSGPRFSDWWSCAGLRSAFDLPIAAA
ncbi:hypothetical protein ZEAMMB73_Zm00001d033107 [Zea mays]|uniref:Uncharacterized protein n=1 Tax=Zea mays TaxID=4577 RepID=A0A1D6KWC0_MAIZE|nr:hypothetical protein ZEAMMB73_Zm00001d033107 [Zea mays]